MAKAASFEALRSHQEAETFDWTSPAKEACVVETARQLPVILGSRSVGYGGNEGSKPGCY